MKQSAFCTLAVIAFLIVSLSSPAVTVAADTGNPFGLGIISGEPTGVSGKFWIDGNSAIDGAVAWSFAKDFNFHIHADWLFHNWTFLKKSFEVEQGEIPLYYGVGGRMRFDDDPRVGVRFVVGLAYMWDNAPFDVFFEVAPVLDLAPETELDGNIAIGVRYWFQ